MPSFDPQPDRKLHLVGIGGCGMSGIARILHEMGYKLSGSDVKEGPNTLRLRELGVKIFIGHEASQVRDADILVVSSAISKTNPEQLEAEAKGIKIAKRAEVLAWVMNQSKNRIAVAGTHGKTTTTAMIAKVMDAARLQPSYLIGCDMDYIDGNARLGKGDFCVAEADESDSSFLLLSPTAEVITNIEADHMEHFGSMEELLRTFREFTGRNSPEGFMVMDGTDKYNQEIIKQLGSRLITYGFDPSLDYSARDISFEKGNSHYIVQKGGMDLGEAELSIPGQQNVLNSLAVFALVSEYGIDFQTIASALKTFVGARRRFSRVGEHDGIIVFDDYAHHPTEIRATLSAARSGWPGSRLICVFQPHRFSRTFLLKDLFASAFQDADLTIITDIYAASEQPIPGISGQTIVDLLPADRTVYIPRKELVAEYLAREVKDNDIVLTLGAGDIFTVGKELLSRLKMKT